MPIIPKRASLVRKPKAAARSRRRVRQVFDRFHVVVTNSAGIPRDTTGWTAVMTRTGGTTQTANFDEFGVARFTNLVAPTNFSYTLRVRNADGDLVSGTPKSVPADLEVVVVRIV
ncbi:hypothetical protein [Paenibacillus puerhi]|uniref:hypothetical protein n=1 Tax=Paenibacillus puerhi TaxID=2692622 RepID=UPI001359FFF3|nr:hypothetical protein [Paenibacillus puerhi]